ncbi:MAG: MBL fold metallo-hydrolase [Ktedonobacteraceae bacterium]|nr:MBL fold metallo-hydrolase [Ktedonobacteraceae bacterium]
MHALYKSGESLIHEIHETAITSSGLALWSLGQMGFVLKGSPQDGFVCIDPYLTHSIEQDNPGTEFVREFEPPVTPESLAGASAILITHQHNDHLDLATIRTLTQVSPQTFYALPAPHLPLLRRLPVEEKRIIAARDGVSFSVAGFSITPVAAAHPNYETDSQENHLYLGYCITVNGIRLYHSGDTSVTKELLERVRAFKPHIVILPINGGDYARTARGIVGNMSAREAADFGVAVGADLIIPAHYDMFPNNRDNPAFFVDYLFQTYRTQKFHMLIPGERFIYLS